MPEKTPVECIEEGALVRAVEHGPLGLVTDTRAGWTIVSYRPRHPGYSSATMSYKHRLYVEP